MDPRRLIGLHLLQALNQAVVARDLEAVLAILDVLEVVWPEEDRSFRDRAACVLMEKREGWIP
jgi:hypothetical protein